MQTINDSLQQTLVHLIEQNFSQKALRDSALESLHFKKREGSPFGKLAILHYELFGGSSDTIYPAAAAVELLIASSDIFDDLQDQDNDLPPWSKWSPALSMNLATALLSLSTKVFNELPIAENCKQQIDFLCLQAINGQHEDLVNTIQTEQNYLEVATQKAGSLVALASLVGTGLTMPSHVNIVRDYSILLGVVEQIKNDLNDLLTFEKNDWQIRKISLPILYLYENNINCIVIDYFEGRISYEEILKKKEDVVQFLSDSGATMYAQFVSRKYQLLATKLLDEIPFNDDQKNKIKQAFHFA